MRTQQITLQDWQWSHYIPVAMLLLTPTDIVDKYGINFSEQSDSLGEQLIAYMKLDNTYFSFCYYIDCDEAGTNITIDARRNDLPSKLIEQILIDIGISQRQLSWKIEDDNWLEFKASFNY